MPKIFIPSRLQFYQMSTPLQAQFYMTRPDIYTLTSTILHDTSRHLRVIVPDLQTMLGISPSNKSTISTNPCLHKVFNPNLNLKTKLIGVCVNTLIYVSNLPPTAIQDEP